ncbi:hypothetical protein L596_021862 [Steinernema carpocapsae]|uniref:Uncharacterized protein n=1 Tax=Steinernema carpocapsae TaxID=34508 RepID=A0A4U5MKD5_STECR|nr:hypothetical protein L596_021862 [Steinernema carpocapsae]
MTTSNKIPKLNSTSLNWQLMCLTSSKTVTSSISSTKRLKKTNKQLGNLIKSSRKIALFITNYRSTIM